MRKFTTSVLLHDMWDIKKINGSSRLPFELPLRLANLEFLVLTQMFVVGKLQIIE